MRNIHTDISQCLSGAYIWLTTKGINQSALLSQNASHLKTIYQLSWTIWFTECNRIAMHYDPALITHYTMAAFKPGEVRQRKIVLIHMRVDYALH